MGVFPLIGFCKTNQSFSITKGKVDFTESAKELLGDFTCFVFPHWLSVSLGDSIESLDVQNLWLDDEDSSVHFEKRVKVEKTCM